MLKNFEKETEKLSEYEKSEILPILSKILEKTIGKKLALTNSQIVMRYLPGVGEARVRKVINYIRNKDIINGLMATNKGYYIGTSREELKEYIESLEGRIGAIQRVMQSIKRQMDKMYPPE